MKSQEILSILDQYRTRVVEVLGAELKTDITATSAYSFIIITAGEIHIQFEISETSSKLQSCHNISKEAEKKIRSLTWPGLNEATAHPFSERIVKQLTTADSVASLGLNCTTGDSYRPGNFSKVIYTKNNIELQQVNYMNAKSLDHKHDYSLRSLVFRIALNTEGR